MAGYLFALSLFVLDEVSYLVKIFMFITEYNKLLQ